MYLALWLLAMSAFPESARSGAAKTSEMKGRLRLRTVNLPRNILDVSVAHSGVQFASRQFCLSVDIWYTYII